MPGVIVNRRGKPGAESGYVLLETLGLMGWSVAITKVRDRGLFAGEGIQVTAVRGDREIVERGPTVAHIASLVYDRAMRC